MSVQNMPRYVLSAFLGAAAALPATAALEWKAARHIDGLYYRLQEIHRENMQMTPYNIPGGSFESGYGENVERGGIPGLIAESIRNLTGGQFKYTQEFNAGNGPAMQFCTFTTTQATGFLSKPKEEKPAFSYRCVPDPYPSR